MRWKVFVENVLSCILVIFRFEIALKRSSSNNISFCVHMMIVNRVKADSFYCTEQLNRSYSSMSLFCSHKLSWIIFLSFKRRHGSGNRFRIPRKPVKHWKWISGTISRVTWSTFVLFISKCDILYFFYFIHYIFISRYINAI